MDAREALDFYGFQPRCSCNHQLEQHEDDGAGPCRDLDSYDTPCGCPSYDAERDQAMRR